jgi:hypothetical protein
MPSGERSKQKMSSPELEEMTAAQLTTKTIDALRRKWEEWQATLPAEAASWPIAAVYVRESHINSMVGDSPALQITATLEMLRGERVNVPWDLVTFENVSGTAMNLRPRFQRLLDRAKAGEFKIIAAYLSHRLFRNSEEATAVKRQLRLKGVRLLWVGKPTMDDRDPSSWAMERNMEIADEWHSRNTGWLVGRALEYKTLAGEPIGLLPEVWTVTERAPGARSRNGRPVKWELVQPIADIVKEGGERYIAGLSFMDLAEWSLTTDLKGISPSGRTMSWNWWKYILQNPKIAGYHRPSMYMGFKPGKEAPRRVRVRHDRDNLVRCLLPPLITLEQHRAIIALGKRRNSAAKRRRRYRDEVISSIAQDARCGHRVAIVRHSAKGGVEDYYVRCQASVTQRGHGSSFRAKDAADQLEALISAITFDDEALLASVEAGLAAIKPERELTPRTPRNAEGVQLRAALASLNGAQFTDLRADITERLQVIERAAEVIQVPTETAIFRAAVSDLRRWPEIWSRATAIQKNELLRAAGVTIHIEPVQLQALGRKAPPRPYSRLVKIEASVPEFALALAVASKNVAALSSSASEKQWNAATSDSAPTTLSAGPTLSLSDRHVMLLRVAHLKGQVRYAA